MNEIKKIKASELLPNPNRNLKYYKLNPKRVDALIASFKASGEWPGIVVRLRPDGRYEKAFGEHRAEAHRRVFGKESEIPVIVMALDDAAMLRYMANENGEAWENSFLADVETVESTVKRFAEGKITLSTVSAQTNKARLAPSFISLRESEIRRATDPSKLYTANSVTEFLGWGESVSSKRVNNDLNALELIEQGVFERRHFEGLNTNKAEALIKETKRLHKNAEAFAGLGMKPHDLEKLRVEVPRKVSDALRDQERTATIYETTNALMDAIIPRQHRLPMLDIVIDKLSAEIRGFIDAGNQTKRAQKIQEILEVQGEMSDESRRKLAQLKAGLDYLGHRCLELAKAIRPLRSRRVAVALE